GSLTIDVVDQQEREVLWSGTAKARVSGKDEDNPRTALDKAVTAIFIKYPKQPLVASSDNR
ncbi:MAG TPA: DUF4136 domain-containing protein, partial [Steroidobacteraceae bacterium]|nr:DUF4136 domain-containing protein [Steroidobacteraceae bacterium]